MRAARVAALALATVVAGCSGGDGEGTDAAVVLDGSPRVADDTGRLVEVAEDFSTLTLEDAAGARTYELHPAFVSFSALDASVQPLLRWRNQYVQVGLDGDEAVWLGGLAAVVDVPGAEPLAYFTDVLVESDGESATFRSGTVLPLAAGVAPPSAPPVPVVATVDVETHRIVALDPG